MWIIPKSITSAYALATEALISDSAELSEACAQSLFVRSKPSPSRTWSLKWKRDSWTQHLFGRALRTSHSESFVDWWISSLEATRANRSPPQESEKEKTTPGTSGPGSQMVFDFVNQDCASSRTSRDTSRWDSPQSSATWKKWVTKCRGEYSARLKSAPRTSASGCSFSPRGMAGCHSQADSESASWPTPRTQDSKHGECTQYELGRDKGKDLLHVRVERESKEEQKMWPTASARDWKDSPGMSKTGINPDGSTRERTDQLARAVYVHGQQDQDNVSTGGNHPASSGQSQQNWQTFAPGTNNRGETPHRQVVKALVNGEKPTTQCLTVDQVFAEEIKGTNKQREAWPTPVVTDSIGSGNRNLEGSKAHAGESLTDVVNGGQKARVNKNTGRLNPRWVETLMGVPIGWTMPSCTSPVTIEPTN